MRIVVACAALAVACSSPAPPSPAAAAPPAPTAAPEQVVRSCVAADAGPVAEPWGGLEPSPTADPAMPGFMRLFHFTAGDGRGRGALVRLGNAATGQSLFRGERREWALTARLEDDTSFLWVYSYLDGSRASDAWSYRAGTRTVARYAVSRPSGDLFAWACALLEGAAFGREPVIREVSDGMSGSRPKLRRLLTPPFVHGDR